MKKRKFDRNNLAWGHRLLQRADITFKQAAIGGLFTLLFAFTTDVHSQAGNALDFDGIDDFVNCGSSFGQIGAEFTLEVWVNPRAGYGTFPDPGQPVEVISRWGAGGAGNAAYLLGINSSGKARLNVYDGSVGGGILSTSTIPVNTWTHIAGTRDASDNLNIYINGALDASGVSAIVPQSSNYNLQLGRPSAGPNVYNGQMDEVRIWSETLSAPDIAAHYNKTFTNPTSSSSCLLGYYKLNESTGTTTADASGNGNTGTLVAMMNDDWVTSTIGVTSGSVPSCPSVAAAVPTLGQWGLIILSLLMMSIVMVFSTAPKMAMAGGQNIQPKVTLQNFAFDKNTFFKMWAMIAAFSAIGFFTAMNVFGYELTNADPIGSVVASGIVAYMMTKMKENRG